MRCPLQNTLNRAVLLDYCARKLPATTGADLELHLATCVQCTEWVAGHRQVWAQLDDWELAPFSPDFDRRLYSRIEEHKRNQWFRRLLTADLGWRPAMPVAAACVVLVAAVVVFTPRTPPGTPLRDSSRLEVIEPEQVERSFEDLEMLKQLSSAAPSQSL